MSITLTRADQSARDQLQRMCPTGSCPADLQSCTHIPLISANQSSTSLLPSSQAPIERPLDFQQLFSDALDEYKRQTGTSLDSHPLGDKLKSCNSVDDVVAILTDQSRSFEDFRKKAPLMTRLKPIVNVVISVSETLGEGVALAFSPAQAIFCGIGVLLTAAKEISSSYDALGDLFDHTANFLVRSKKYTQILPSNSEMKIILAKTLAQVIVIFALATKQVKQGRFMKYGKKLLKEKDVEDALKKLDNLTTEEARMTAMQCLEAIYLLFDKMKLVMDGETAATNEIRDALGKIHSGTTVSVAMTQRLVSAVSRVERYQMQELCRKWLSPPDPSINHDAACKARYEGTAQWLIESEALKDWKMTRSLIWIRGESGSGKSILSSAIIEDIKHLCRTQQRSVMAYFYCDLQEPAKRSVRGVLSFLLLRLAAWSDDCANVLSRLYAEYDSGLQRADDAALKRTLMEMLSLSVQDAIYIIIDALDKCPASSGIVSPRDEVLDLINELIGLPINIHICVTSRPEPDIQNILVPLASRCIDLHAESEQVQDITLYVSSVVKLDSAFKQWTEENKMLAIRTLSRQADRMFRWVSYRLEILRSCLPADIEQTLNTLSNIPGTAHRPASGPASQNGLPKALCSLDQRGADAKVQKDKQRPMNPLQVAASNGHLNVVHFLVERGADTDALTLALRSAALGGHLEIARFLIDHGANVNASSHKHLPPTALGAASFHGHLSVVRFLIERGAEVNLGEGEHTTALRDAAWGGHLDVVRFLVKHGANPNGRGGKPYPASVLGAASHRGHLDIVRFLVENGAQVDFGEGKYTTALRDAAWSGQLEVVRYLVECGADVNMRSSEKKPSTALGAASFHGHLDIVQFLIEHGAEVNAGDGEHVTALREAAWSGHLDVVRFLLEHGANVNTQGHENSPLAALGAASRQGHLDVVRFLIERGAQVNFGEGKYTTALRAAAWGGQFDAVRYLVEHGAHVNAFSKNCPPTALGVASYHGRLDIAQFLVEHGAEVDAGEGEHSIALREAAWNGHLDVVRFLVEHGANPNGRSGKGYPMTVLGTASYRGHLDMVRFLVEHGAQVNMGDGECTGALRDAAWGGHLDIVRFLVEHGANVNAWTTEHTPPTPLGAAASHGHLDIVQFLVEHGAEVNMGEGKYSTALHEAAWSGHLDVVRFLVAYGASMNARSNSCTPPTVLGAASRKGHLDVVRFLVEQGADVEM